jgi:hypothetical protein
LGDCLKDALLVGRIALDGLYKVGDQLGPTGELNVDPSERLINADAQLAKLVEGRNDEQSNRYDEYNDDEYDNQHAISLAVAL